MLKHPDQLKSGILLVYLRHIAIQHRCRLLDLYDLLLESFHWCLIAHQVTPFRCLHGYWWDLPLKWENPQKDQPESETT